jgi:hypothetical protein
MPNSYFSHTYYFTCSSQPLGFIILMTKLMKSTIKQFSPASCYFFRLRSKYSAQHTVLRHPVLQLMCKKRFHPYKKWVKLWFLVIFMILHRDRKAKNSELNGNKQLPNLIFSELLGEYNLDLVQSYSNILSLQHV